MGAREDLQQVATYRMNLPQVTADTIKAARGEGITWPEIARILGMTTDGARKAYARWSRD